MLVDDSGLRFSETDEVNDVGEDLDEAVVGRFDKVIEGEISNTALRTCQPDLKTQSLVNCSTSTSNFRSDT